MARVLIVEDEHPLQHIIALNLVRRGHEVAEADSVETANMALQTWEPPFDVILLDVNLPDQTGWDVLRGLRRRASPSEGGDDQMGKPPKVIIVSAMRPPQAYIEQFHPDAVLVKPFPLQALLRLIERVLAATPSEEDSEGRANASDVDSSFGAPPNGALHIPTEA